MRLENYIDLQGIPGSSGLFFACGSFGMIDGDCNYSCSEKDGQKLYRYSDEKVALVATFSEEKNGVMIRKDYLENLTDSPIELNGFLSRFHLDGNAYEVYTQYNSWLHESSGGWQKLITQVTAAAQGIRTCDSATPMMALHNLYTRKNTVFHLMPNAQWKMTARKFPQNDKEIVVVETGFCSEGLHLQVLPGEKIELPAVIFFSAENKIDLDAYKLHEVYNALYPRKRMPILYNSWLYCFGDLDVDSLMRQADHAAAMGFEAFMIDAGWFGKGDDWGDSVGDWYENTLSGPKGRLLELSEHVRQKGMIFGLWFEPERAGSKSQAAKIHPDHYINNTFLDFANPDAVDHMIQILSQHIEKYSIGWLKFDFNASLPLDPSGNGFYRYMQGQRRFIETLRSKYPHLYITNCASGGYRMELGQGTMFDSFWLSDNQGPYQGLEIVKNTLKRMPPCMIERWNVQKYSEGFMRYGHKEKVGVMFSCNDGTWDFIINVDDSFTKAFLTGGPFGFSCDLAEFPDAYKEMWRNFISQYKKEREFYSSATARVLADTGEISMIEYADCGLERCVIQVFTKTTYARELMVYPVVNRGDLYQMGDSVLSGQDILENGIFVGNLKNNSCRTIELVKK